VAVSLVETRRKKAKSGYAPFDSRLLSAKNNNGANGPLKSDSFCIS
jgi:hypothetical protein